MSATATPAIKIDATSKLDGVGTAHDYKYKTIMTSVETFKTAVIRIRDILRGPGVSITGMDSMRHICLYLLSRYMTRAKVASLEVPEEFAWETFIETAQTKNGGVQKALDCFYHAEEDCLVRHFDRLFGTDKFSFDIKNPQKHKEILEILNAVNMEDVDCQMDTLGWVYEQHLKTGASAGGQRDLGQYFTDRSVCEYMTELCKPGFKSAGVPESVCDPAMGTGGFLTAFINYFKKNHEDKPIDWSVQQKEIHGCDTDPRVAGVARLNLFMETGGNRTTNIQTHDSLYGDLTQTGYDVILANMPFGIDNIKHAECCERVKALKIRGTKSEPLFLQLMMTSLNMGGRCAVVVPDGMLVNKSILHKNTRKYLFEKFELKKVIKMKAQKAKKGKKDAKGQSGQFFMNTNIQPSILLFEKTGKSTSNVEFYEIEKADKGLISEHMITSVPISKFDDTYSLDIRHYIESESPVSVSAGHSSVKLTEVVSLKYGFPFKSTDYKTEGLSVVKHNNITNGIVSKSAKQDYISSSEQTTDFKLKIVDVVISMDFDCGKVGKIIEDGWVLNQRVCLARTKSDTLRQGYLYWYLRIGGFYESMQMLHTGTTIKHISGKDIEKATIVLPPLSVQDEIVKCLDAVYSEFGNSITLTKTAWNIIITSPKMETYRDLFEACKMLKSAEVLMSSIGGSVQSKFSL